MSEPKVGSAAESLAQTQAALRTAMDEAEAMGDIQAKLSYQLRMLLEPGWMTWLKESGANGPQIALAISDAAAALIAETVRNIAKPGQEEILAKNLGFITAQNIMGYTTSTNKIADVDGFRRRDS